MIDIVDSSRNSKDLVLKVLQQYTDNGLKVEMQDQSTICVSAVNDRGKKFIDDLTMSEETFAKVIEEIINSTGYRLDEENFEF